MKSGEKNGLVAHATRSTVTGYRVCLLSLGILRRPRLFRAIARKFFCHFSFLNLGGRLSVAAAAVATITTVTIIIGAWVLRLEAWPTAAPVIQPSALHTAEALFPRLDGEQADVTKPLHRRRLNVLCGLLLLCDCLFRRGCWLGRRLDILEGVYLMKTEERKRGMNIWVHKMANRKVN